MSASLRKAIAEDDISAFQKAYLGDLARPLKRLRKQAAKLPLLALWSEDTIELSGRERELAASLDEMHQHPTGARERRKGKRSKAENPYEEILANWLVESAGISGPWETIVIAEILLREGHRLTAERFTSTLAVLTDSMLHESIGGLFEGTEAVPEDEDPVRRIISAGESKWLGSLLLTPLQGTQSLQKSAVDALEKELADSTDEEGIIRGALLRRLSEWLVPLARCTFWSDIFEQPLWSDDGGTRLAAAAERAAMLVLPVSPHHDEADAPESSVPSLSQVLEFLLPRSDSDWEHRLRKLLKECRKPADAAVSGPKKFKKKKSSHRHDSSEESAAENPKRRLPVSWQSDNSCAAVLRSGAEADADVVSLEWHSADAQIMLAAAGVPILAGAWTCTVRLDDEVIPAPTAWKCSCWFLDPETVFVELEGEGSGPVRQVRQLLLAPRDRFAILTDSVTSESADGKVTLVTSVPLAEGACCTPVAVTRELSLSNGPRTVRTFPVWMEDDRIRHALGSYREQDGRMEMSAVGKGGVTMPLALDWDPRRTDAPAEWSRLTVTESRRIVGDHEATGHRVRIGDHQVLIYRSLIAGKNSRAVLGLHTWDESVYSRVPSKPGPLQPFVEVESPE